MKTIFPRSILPPHIAETIDRFVGRTWLLQPILDWFNDDRQPPLYLIIGPPGAGKGMIAAWLAGFGPEPDDPAARANLQALREHVAGAHFCQVDSIMNEPKTMADRLARQLIDRVTGYDDALKAFLGQGQGVVNVNATVGSVAAGANLTLSSIGTVYIDLSRLLGPGGVEQAVIHPLRWAYEHGFNEKILLIFDALDEARLYKSDYKITDAVLELVRLKLPVRILATTRDETDVRALFNSSEKTELVISSAHQALDVSDYVDSRLENLTTPKAAEIKRRIKDNAGDNFLFAHFVIEDYLRRLKDNKNFDLDDIPATLVQYYHEAMRRLGTVSQWRKQYGKLFGLAAVAQDRGLERALFAKIMALPSDDALVMLQAVKPFLEGSLDDGPFRSFHKSFTEFLLEDEDNKDYKISAPDPHAGIVYSYWPRKKAVPPRSDWDDYARRHMVTHLAGAGRSQDEEERHRMAQRLVATVSEPVLRDYRVIQSDDLADTAQRLAAAVDTACGDDLTDGLPLVVRAVRAYQYFAQMILQPGHIFTHAALGETGTALQKLSLFTVEPRWRKAAMLVCAWLAVDKKPENAAAMLELVSTTPPFPSPLNQLLNRVKHALGGPKPALLPLPKPPDPYVIDEMLAGILGHYADRGKIEDYRSGVHIEFDRGLSEQLNARGDEIPAYEALELAPIFVSFANPQSEQGDRHFEEYLHINAANLYVYYRNQTLWILLEAVLRHPEVDWARKMARQILELALVGERTPFEESTPLVLLGLRTSAGEQKAKDRLETLKNAEIVQAGELDESRRKSDTFGLHKRRLCALALAYRAAVPEAAAFGAGTPETDQLLRLALDIPRGFAGLLYRAWLTLHQSLQICAWPNPADLQHCLDEAMRSAQKIQDPNFCVMATARMRTMRDEWLAMFPRPLNLRAVVEQFARKPLSPPFAPLYRVDDDYPMRGDDDEKHMPLTYDLTHANMIGMISDLFGLSMEGLLEINEDINILEATLIPDKTLVRLYDPEFVPLAAQRLSAEVAASGLGPREKRRLIQLLIPHALSDRTVLDTILARLMFVSNAQDFDALDVPAPASEPEKAGQAHGGASQNPQGVEPITGYIASGPAHISGDIDITGWRRRGDEQKPD